MSDGLNKLGWGVYRLCHEDANFQYEINFRCADALTTADRLTFFRMMAGQVAPQVRSDRHLHAQAVRESDRLREPISIIISPTPRPAATSSSTRVTVAVSVFPSLCYHFLGGVSIMPEALCPITSPTR